jgi:hypothetical protein
MPFGAQITNWQTPFFEGQIGASWSGVNLTQGQVWRPTVATMSMPFTGDIFVDLWVQSSYTMSILASSVWPYTTIGPSNYYAGKVGNRDVNGGVFPVPLVARWANVPVYTSFSLTIEIRCDIADGVMSIQQVAGFIRAQAAA